MQTTERITTQAQPPAGELPIPMELDPAAATPVYGTGEPTEGAPAQLRRLAHGLPQHDPSHWLLLLADRVESGGNLLREAASLGQQELVLRHFGRQLRAYPDATAAFGALALGGVALAALARGR